MNRKIELSFFEVLLDATRISQSCNLVPLKKPGNIYFVHGIVKNWEKWVLPLCGKTNIPSHNKNAGLCAPLCICGFLFFASLILILVQYVLNIIGRALPPEAAEALLERISRVVKKKRLSNQKRKEQTRRGSNFCFALCFILLHQVELHFYKFAPSMPSSQFFFNCVH